VGVCKMFFVQKRVSRKDTLPRMKLVNRDESPSRPRLLGRGCGRTDNATQTELGLALLLGANSASWLWQLKKHCDDRTCT